MDRQTLLIPNWETLLQRYKKVATVVTKIFKSDYVQTTKADV